MVRRLEALRCGHCARMQIRKHVGDIVDLAQLDARGTKDRAGGHDVEVELGQGPIASIVVGGEMEDPSFGQHVAIGVAGSITNLPVAAASTISTVPAILARASAIEPGRSPALRPSSSSTSIEGGNACVAAGARPLRLRASEAGLRGKREHGGASRADGSGCARSPGICTTAVIACRYEQSWQIPADPRRWRALSNGSRLRSRSVDGRRCRSGRLREGGRLCHPFVRAAVRR